MRVRLWNIDRPVALVVARRSAHPTAEESRQFVSRDVAVAWVPASQNLVVCVRFHDVVEAIDQLADAGLLASGLVGGVGHAVGVGIVDGGVDHGRSLASLGDTNSLIA